MVFRKACGMVPDVNIILTAPVAEVYREQWNLPCYFNIVIY
jgi:hypothetical protein